MSIEETSENVKPRYHGFTCPKCSSHMFGTHRHHVKFMGEKYPDGTLVGSCKENEHSGNGCTFEWNRNNPEAEAECMYEQTHEEWMANFSKASASA